ncbi:OmpP1/FadL family transporter [Acinetobacter junii]|uniref:Transporter n=1 Tax=Acinetobacter junii TaxID=40215 RepID=A0AAW5R873_ACIJU|nr:MULTISPECIES: transporter [Acinetobacter]MBY3624059.1 transporter [Acinetobacter sp. CUI P1]MCU4396446.1 transporter [Acinetobacter junii]MCU4407579.1 transporter [Acinetobacter junii]MDH1689375.1 transporter [Acinetobacter junii]MDI9721160.1 transporter [Acinetobacter junii]
MKLKYLSTAMVLATLPATGAFAAALDRSGQSMSAFFQPGNYFEAGLSVLDADVSGTTKANYPNAALPLLSNTSVGEMADSYQFAHAALKLQLADQLSFGLIYDQPFGAKATYSTDTAKLPAALPGAAAALQGQGAFHNGTQGTSVEVETQNLSMILGFQPNKNLNFYAGPVYQTVKGNIQLRGTAYGGSATFGGYNADIKETGDIGWLAGAAYQIPEIALKASVTYRSEIKHSTDAKESFSSLGLFAGLNAIPAKETDITTPQSVNLDLQTGIMADTVAFANVRWVNWKDFAVRPYKFGVASTQAAVVASTGKKDGFDLVAYTDDQWSVTTGVGRKLNEHWAGNVSVGWDSGAGNPVTTLGPTEGYWNVGLGIQYSPAPNYFIAGGVKYFWLGDAKAQAASQFDTPNYVAEFEDNNAIAYGLKLGYRF